MVPTGGAYKDFMITDPLLKVLGAGADKPLNFKEVDPDRDYSRTLKKGLIGRNGIEAISILAANYMW